MVVVTLSYNIRVTGCMLVFTILFAQEDKKTCTIVEKTHKLKKKAIKRIPWHKWATALTILFIGLLYNSPRQSLVLRTPDSSNIYKML